MNLWPHSLQKKSDKNTLILVLERGYVWGGNFNKTTNSFSVVTSQELLPYGTDKNQSFFSATLLALEHVLGTFKESKEPMPTEATIFLPQALYAVQTAHLVKEAEKPFLITRDVVTDMVNTDRARRSLYLFKEENGTDSPAVTIEERLLSVRLNGYDVHNPYGKKARQISLLSMYSVSPKSVLEKIAEIITRSCGTLHLEYYPGVVSFAAAYFHTTRTIQNFAFVWPMRDQTEIALVHNGQLGYVGVIPYGFGTAVEQLAKRRGSHEKEIIDLLQDTKNTTLETLDPAFGEFREIFTKTLESASPGTYLPQHFIFPGGVVASAVFAHWLSENTFWELSKRFRSMLKSASGKEVPSVHLSALGATIKKEGAIAPPDTLILAGSFTKESRAL